MSGLKVLMLSWEFPPNISGGLGVACYGLSRALARQGAKITFVVPSPVPRSPKFLRLISSQSIAIEKSESSQQKELDFEQFPSAYFDPDEYQLWLQEAYDSGYSKVQIYGPDLFSEIERFSRAVAELAEREYFDIIHCHDWLTIKAGIEAKKRLGCPLVFHIHSIEYDRNPTPNPKICELERQGVGFADVVICVSNYTKRRVMEFYQAPESKLRVIYNGIELKTSSPPLRSKKKRKRFQQIIFLGRLTWQKGPEYFIETARLMLEKRRDLRFIFIGWGDLVYQLVERVAELGLGSHILFAGFLEERAVKKLVSRSDLFLLTSVSEPFGLAVLEAIIQGVPAVISAQSGVSEILEAVPRANYWESERYCEYALELLSSPELCQKQILSSWEKIKEFSWERAGRLCREQYQKLLV